MDWLLWWRSSFRWSVTQNIYWRKPAFNRMDPYVDLFQSHGGSMIMLAKGNRSRKSDRCLQEARRLLPRFYRWSGGHPCAEQHQEHRVRGIPWVGDGSHLEKLKWKTSLHLSWWTTKATISILDVHMWYIYLLIGLYLFADIFACGESWRKPKLCSWQYGGVTLKAINFIIMSLKRNTSGGTCSWNSGPAFLLFCRL